MTKIAHLLGNGPSRKFFINEPKGDIYGCNLSDENLDLKASFIMDFVVLAHLYEKRVRLNWPIIIQGRYKRFCETEIQPRPIIAGLWWKEMENGQSTGHHAFMYLLEHGYDEIHLWGFDALALDNCKSDTQDKMPKAPFWPTNYLRWRDLWNRLFATEKAKAAKVIVHLNGITQSVSFAPVAQSDSAVVS